MFCDTEALVNDIGYNRCNIRRSQLEIYNKILLINLDYLIKYFKLKLLPLSILIPSKIKN